MNVGKPSERVLRGLAKALSRTEVEVLALCCACEASM